MIRRKDTLGFMDFMRGKYSIYNKEYLLNLLNEMTVTEKRDILEKDFDTLWIQLWSNNSGQYKSEEEISRDKYNALISGIMTQTETYTLADLVKESTTSWEEAEWGFPKGRRNHNEKDVDCALREFTEETGYSLNKIVENIQPFEEIFMGSNYRSYKHKYYLMFMENMTCNKQAPYDKSEVSKIEWKTYDECIASIRPYNLEKKRMLTNIYHCIQKYVLCHS
jgi:8-oxo-dGTP pyrophosphatase MutT (NUDIX family)